MDTASSRPYQPGLSPRRPLVVLVVTLCFVVALPALAAVLIAATAASTPAEQLLAPFRWFPNAIKALA